MAGPISLADFEAAPAPSAAPVQGLSLDSFDSHPAQSSSVSLSDFESYPVGPATQETPLPIEDAAKRVIVENIPDSFKYMAGELSSYLHTSGIFDVLEKLQRPQAGLTAAAVKGLDITNVAPGIQGRLNPTGNILPKGLAPHDILYDMLPTNDTVEAKAKVLAEKFGIGRWSSDSVRLLYAADKGLLGMVGDFVLDPINLVGGALGRGAEALGKAGEAIAQSEKGIAIAKGAAKTVQTAEKVPIAGSLVYAGKRFAQAGKEVAGGAVDVWRSLLPYTNIKEIDDNWVIHSGMSKAISPSVRDEVLGPIKHIGVTDSEGEILFNALENVKNSSTPEEISKAIGDAASKQKISLNPERQQQLVEAGQHLRGALENNISREVEAGLRSPFYGKEVEESPGKMIRVGVIEGYVPHRMSAEAKKWAQKTIESGKNPSEIIDAAIKDEMVKAGIDFEKGAAGSWVSDFDVGAKTRKIRLPVQDANEYLKNSIGVDKFFVTDPILATAYKVAETKKLVLDKGLLDVIKKYGISAAKAPRGWKPIEHYALSITNDLRFPPEIADKIGFYIARPPTGTLLQKVDQYQWLFKRLALAKPDYYIQNIGENSVKALALGATPKDFAYATKVMSGKGVVQLKNGAITATDLRKEIVELGIDSGGVFKEGIDQLVYMGQKMTRDGVLKGVVNAPAKVLQGAMEMGEKGENWARRALYISLRRSGYAAKDAALTVERVMFDFGRVTPAMNKLRRLVPFVQPVIKTANILPELIAKNPRLYNFLNNNMFQAMQSAFNDPVTNQELYAIMGKSISDRYKQNQDPTFSVLLPGNNWISKYLVNKGPNGIPNEGAPWQGQAGGNVLVQFKAPIQFDLLNQLLVFSENSSMLTGGGAGPLVRAFMQFFAGKDVFTGKDIDVAKDYIDIAARTNAAANTLIDGAIPFPNLIKMVKKWAGIGDPKWIEPTSVQVLQGTIGRFVTVTNLDKDFFFRMLVMNKYRKELMQEFMSRAAKEQQQATSGGKVTDIGNMIRGWSQAAFSSARTHDKLMESTFEMQRMNMARAGIVGKMTPVEILKNIKMIERNVKELNHNYRTVSQYRLKAVADAKLNLDQIQGTSNSEGSSGQ